MPWKYVQLCFARRHVRQTTCTCCEASPQNTLGENRCSQSRHLRLLLKQVNCRLKVVCGAISSAAPAGHQQGKSLSEPLKEAERSTRTAMTQNASPRKRRVRRGREQRHDHEDTLQSPSLHQLLEYFFPRCCSHTLCTVYASELEPDVHVVAGLNTSLKHVRHLASNSAAIGSSPPHICTSWQVAGRAEQRPTRCKRRNFDRF